jgi:glycosyltransferase involved in cell wall biosynthesis
MSKRICICGVQAPFVRGGAQNLVDSLQDKLCERGFEVEVVQLPFSWVPKAHIVKGALAWRLLDLTQSFGQRIDMVIATRFPSYVVKHPNKVVWLVHQFRQAYDLDGTQYACFDQSPADRRMIGMIRGIDNRVLGEAQGVYGIAQNVSNRLARFNGIQSEPLYPPPQLAPFLHHQSYGDYVFSPSRLESPKRIDLLIKALAMTKSEARCIICGTGTDEHRLRELAAKLGVGDRVVFAGHVSDEQLIELYASCFSVFYAPYDEDYGYVTLEAFLAHKPVITARDSGGVLEFVRDSVNGYVCGTGSPRQIARRIDHLFSRRDLCRALGDAGYERARTITWDTVIDNLTAGL